MTIDRASIGGRANWSGAAFELRLGVQFCVYILIGDAAGLGPGAARRVQLQAPEPVDDLILEFETSTRWAIQAKAGTSVRVGWNSNRPFGKALRQLYHGATSGQIDLDPASLDRVELAVDHRAHPSLTGFGEWLDKARHHHEWEHFVAASTGDEREWAHKLPALLEAPPDDDLLAFLKRLHVRRTLAPDEWWSNLRGQLRMAGVPDNETSDHILDILLAQLIEAAPYAGQLDINDLQQARQDIPGISSPIGFIPTQINLELGPNNMRQPAVPLAIYTARTVIAASVVLPPLVFLVLRWYFYSPDTVMEGIAWVVPTIGVWAAFLANLSQFTGFSLRDLWDRANLETRWLQAMAAVAIILASVLITTTLLAVIRWRNLVDRQNLPIYPNKIVILVAEFSEGALYEVPTDRTVTHKILTELQQLESRDTKIDIVELGRVILDRDTARRLGYEREAVAVVWGTYTRSPTHVLVEPHFEVVSPSVGVFARDHLEEPVERVIDVEEIDNFRLHFELSQEMTFLSAFVAGLTHYWEEDFDQAIADFNLALDVIVNDERHIGLESIHYYKGIIYRQQEKYSEAEKEFKESITINPMFAAGYNVLGITYGTQDRTDQAVEQYLRAIEVNPQFTSAYNNLAVAYGVQGKPVEIRLELYKKGFGN